jgi:CheY-like chemotaxis protein
MVKCKERERLIATRHGRHTDEYQRLKRGKERRATACKDGPSTQMNGELPRAHAARVVVVDDNVDLAIGLAKLLQIHGHHVEIAHDGPSGLEKVRASKPDFVLLDIGLPGMDGYELAAHIRQDEGIKDTVVIAISGYGIEETDSRRRDFDHQLTKPISPQALIRILSDPRRRRPWRN